jgi:hypothetical protein
MSFYNTLNVAESGGYTVTYPGCTCCGPSPCCLPCDGYMYEKYEIVCTCAGGPCGADTCAGLVGTHTLTRNYDCTSGCEWRSADNMWVMRWDGGGFFNNLRIGWNSWNCSGDCCVDEFLEVGSQYSRAYVPCSGDRVTGYLLNEVLTCANGSSHGITIRPTGAIITCGCVPACMDRINTAIRNGTLTISTDHGGSANLKTLTVPPRDPVCSDPVVTSLGTWLFFVVMPFWDYRSNTCYDDYHGYGVGTCSCDLPGGAFLSSDCTNTYFNNGWDTVGGECSTVWTMRIWKISDGTLAGTLTISLGGF